MPGAATPLVIARQTTLRQSCSHSTSFFAKKGSTSRFLRSSWRL